MVARQADDGEANGAVVAMEPLQDHDAKHCLNAAEGQQGVVHLQGSPWRQHSRVLQLLGASAVGSLAEAIISNVAHGLAAW